MTIESLAPISIRVRGEVRQLRAGERITLTEEQAQNLLSKAAGKVRVVPSHDDWLLASQRLADITYGVTQEDHRYRPIIGALEMKTCERRRPKLSAG